MARRLYGNVINRIEENRMACDRIEVGTPMTEYFWSDRHVWEVIAVKDQTHVTVRKYTVKHVGEPYSQNFDKSDLRYIRKEIGL